MNKKLLLLLLVAAVAAAGAYYYQDKVALSQSDAAGGGDMVQMRSVQLPQVVALEDTVELSWKNFVPRKTPVTVELVFYHGLGTAPEVGVLAENVKSGKFTWFVDDNWKGGLPLGVVAQIKVVSADGSTMTSRPFRIVEQTEWPKWLPAGTFRSH